MAFNRPLYVLKIVFVTKHEYCLSLIPLCNQSYITFQNAMQEAYRCLVCPAERLQLRRRLSADAGWRKIKPHYSENIPGSSAGTPRHGTAPLSITCSRTTVSRIGGFMAAVIRRKARQADQYIPTAHSAENRCHDMDRKYGWVLCRTGGHSQGEANHQNSRSASVSPSVCWPFVFPWSSPLGRLFGTELVTG